MYSCKGEPAKQPERGGVAAAAKPVRILTLFDLALPLCAHNEALVEAVAKSCILFQTVEQSCTSLTYSVICSSKPDFRNSLTQVKTLIRSKCELGLALVNKYRLR